MRAQARLPERVQSKNAYVLGHVSWHRQHCELVQSGQQRPAGTRIRVQVYSMQLYGLTRTYRAFPSCNADTGEQCASVN